MASPAERVGGGEDERRSERAFLLAKKARLSEVREDDAAAERVNLTA